MDGDAGDPPRSEEEMEDKRDPRGLLKVAIALGFLRYFMVRLYGEW